MQQLSSFEDDYVEASCSSEGVGSGGCPSGASDARSGRT